MFSETAGSRKAIGDVDVLFHEGLYHLFHLVLPNHDFIAHAVSTDGIHWRRVRNAIFIGDPGSWDDLMLWTMHVSPDPYRDGAWRMFYTGLTRRDGGNFQRLGMAISDDLYHWVKHPVDWEDLRGPNDPELVKQAREKSCRKEANDTTALIEKDSCFPLAPDPEYYEASLEEGRHLVSFRDPFFFQNGNFSGLLVAARVGGGPIVRRGCVALYEETEPATFTARPPLHHPMLYDDVEVPNLIDIDGKLYLIGSIREDAKIRYWHADSLEGPWSSFHDNVLMPQGNYAGRVCRDEKGWLLWCFFAMNRADRTDHNLMPPPKRLYRDEEGLLRLRTFEGFADWCGEPVDTRCVRALKASENHFCRTDDKSWQISSPFGFEAFVFEEEFESFWLTGKVNLDGRGKCGLVFHINPETHDGYYLSLDLLKGVAQLRGWGTATEYDGEFMMRFETLQSGYWYNKKPGTAEISLLTFGSYIELSIDGKIILSLADQQFSSGLVGVYLESAELEVQNLTLKPMRNPEQFDNQLISG